MYACSRVLILAYMNCYIEWTHTNTRAEMHTKKTGGSGKRRPDCSSSGKRALVKRHQYDWSPLSWAHLSITVVKTSCLVLQSIPSSAHWAWRHLKNPDGRGE